ncbi:MAG: coproporphyrinogen III oxidase [Streptosporangiales bacterium]|nr:coproporphyrinogen III oxidase [Streptosporangiales bacterium]
MPGSLPDGEPVPSDGSLPASAYDGLGTRPFGVYVHVPFCARRCGYCDFNTYTAQELGEGASQQEYAGVAISEVRLAREVLGARVELPAATVFFGGGTPTLLPADDLARLLDAVRTEFGMAAGAEVTTEANPDSVDEASLARLVEAGFTRISFGMQSAAPRVLRTLDRTHDPERVPAAVAWARAAGFRGVSVDLIYGAPGETTADWQRSLDTAVAMRPDHVSAYSLIVEQGTKLASQVRRGVLEAPDDDVLADRYLQADETLASAGLDWYEVSNWAASPEQRSRHNLLYWTGGDWWGFGPGAHSHVGGTRWWNVRHPRAYTSRLRAGTTPAQAREVLETGERRMERIMLAVRLADGLPVAELTSAGRDRVARAVGEGLADARAYTAGRLALTTRGRLLADALVRDLVEPELPVA